MLDASGTHGQHASSGGNERRHARIYDRRGFGARARITARPRRVRQPLDDPDGGRWPASRGSFRTINGIPLAEKNGSYAREPLWTADKYPINLTGAFVSPIVTYSSRPDGW
jgi:hypothetical protein